MDDITRLDIIRITRRIIEELNTIKEEGFDHETNWYAIDRIASIKDICESLLSGNKLACVNGYGNESLDDCVDFDFERNISI